MTDEIKLKASTNISYQDFMEEIVAVIKNNIEI